MKTNIDKFFKNDETMESEGIWFQISDSIGFRIKRFGGSNSLKVKASLAKYYKPFARQVENGTMDPVKEKEIMTKVFVESCMIDWKGIEIDGKIVEYSIETAIQFFTNLPELMETLITYSQDSKNYREDLGNY